MSYSAILSAAIAEGKSIVDTLIQNIKDNFDSHQSRLNLIESQIIPQPVGSISFYGGGSAPSGFLLCDGSAVSRATYASLFSIIGTTYGVGDGSTTFNLPDMRGRMPLGNGQGSGLTDRNLDDDGGTETHQLTTSEIPSHTHVITDPGHSHEVGGTGSGAVGSLTGSDGTLSTAAFSANDVSTGVTFDSVGGDQAHENMHPWVAVNFIIKA